MIIFFSNFSEDVFVMRNENKLCRAGFLRVSSTDGMYVILCSSHLLYHDQFYLHCHMQLCGVVEVPEDFPV